MRSRVLSHRCINLIWSAAAFALAATSCWLMASCARPEGPDYRTPIYQIPVNEVTISPSRSGVSRYLDAAEEALREDGIGIPVGTVGLYRDGTLRHPVTGTPLWDYVPVIGRPASGMGLVWFPDIAEPTYGGRYYGHGRIHQAGYKHPDNVGDRYGVPWLDAAQDRSHERGREALLGDNQ